MLFVLILFAACAVFFLAAVIFMKSPQFGNVPKGERLRRGQSSPNYKDGQFHNQSVTPQLTEGASVPSIMKDFFFKSKKGRVPPATLPSKKTDIHKLDRNKNVIVWFGHSSYFLQVDGKRILVDPVFSGNASPLRGTTKSFAGSDIYTVDDIPQLDYLIITHDHWDHLDYKTVKQLRPKVGRVITALGVGAHLERWGYDASMIVEHDWYSECDLAAGFKITAMPARHFSGRTFKRNGSLWVSYVLTTPTKKLYLGGDSGYDAHFAEIGTKYGPFDLAILECGQYNKNWKYIHMMPEETVQAAIDLQAVRLMPVHWGKFSLSLHAWDEPIRRAVAEAQQLDVPLVHPVIGAAVDIDDPGGQNQWWLNV